jgi:hypothetical protein
MEERLTIYLPTYSDDKMSTIAASIEVTSFTRFSGLNLRRRLDDFSLFEIDESNWKISVAPTEVSELGYYEISYKVVDAEGLEIRGSFEIYAHQDVEEGDGDSDEGSDDSD